MQGDQGSRAFPHVLTACCLIAVCFATPGDAADTTGEVHGAVVDAEGAGLSGVRVALSSGVLIVGVQEDTTRVPASPADESGRCRLSSADASPV